MRVEVVDTVVGNVVKKAPWDSNPEYSRILWMPDNRRLVVPDEQVTYIFDTQGKGGKLAVLQQIAMGRPFTFTAFADGRRIVAGSLKISVWDVETAKCLGQSKEIVDDYWEPVKEVPGQIRSPEGTISGLPDGKIRDALGYDHLTISADQQWIAAGASNGHVFILDAKTLEFIAEYREPAGWQNDITGVAISQDSSLVLFTTAKGLARLWDWKAKRIVASMGREYPIKDEKVKGRITTAVFAPDGKHIAGACDDGVIRVWELLR
jgi:WD40 repeat protein